MNVQSMTVRRVNSPARCSWAIITGLILGACKTAPAPAPTPAAATVVTVEEQWYRTRADAVRDSLLSRAAFAELGDQCRPGSLRVFPADTTSTAGDVTKNQVRELERIIVARGLDLPVNTQSARALLRLVALWETGGARPFWDAPADTVRREAIAAGLTGEVPDMQRGGCRPVVDQDSARVVVPPGVGLQTFTVDGRRVTILAGDSALVRARSGYFATVNDSMATFTVAQVRVFVLWSGYAVVTVSHPSVRSTGMRVREGNGGGSYVFREIRPGEWRLLVIARTWG